MSPSTFNIIIRQSIDPDAAYYCARSGATDRRVMSDWVRGLKALGVWETCGAWTFLPGQSAGTGSIAHYHGGFGRYDGTLVNGPVWGGDGLSMVAAGSQYVTTLLAQNSKTASIAVVATIPSSTAILRNNLVGDYSGANLGTFSLNFGSNNNGNTTFSTLQNPFNFSGNGAEGGINKGAGFYKDDKPHFLAMSGDRAMPSNEFFQDGEFLQKFPTSANGNPGQPVLIGGSVNPPTARIAFALYSTTRFSQPQWNAVWLLYKSTLGKGLVLS